VKIRRKLWTWLIAVVLVLAVAAAGANVWVEGQYPYSAEAREALVSTKTLSTKTGKVIGRVTVEQTDDAIAFVPSEARAGFIFYPGGLVPSEAYAPLLRALAEEGVLCVVPKMPLRLAVLDMNAADGIAAQYPDITRWAIGGHSLGGAMAASYAAAHGEDFAALVLLAAYSTAEVPAHIAAVSIYGDADQVMNREKYAQYRDNLPESTVELIIPGGNHAQFGDYGVQKGDGWATITPDEQLAQTLQAILPVLLGQ
jgi:dienelactone hydrolase